MILDEEEPMTLGVDRLRPVETASGADCPVRANLPWVVPVGILGTAAEWLTRIAGSRPRPESVDLSSAVRAVRFDLHEVFGEAALILGFCRRRDRRHVLADAAMSLFAAWLVEVEKAAPPASGENVHHLVYSWVVDQSLWTVTREMSTAASLQRLRRLTDELGGEGLDALLRAEVAAGARMSGAALARSDYARSTGSKKDGTRR